MGNLGSVATETNLEWVAAHEALCALRNRRAALDHLEGKVLLRALRARVHERFGYATFAEYVGRWLGYRYHSVEEKLRVAEALERSPELDRALENGELTWSAVRELTRVATPETEKEWIRAASGQTIRQLERLVSGRKPGDAPTDVPKPELVRHVLRFEVSGETFAAFREAIERVRQSTGEALDDDAALMLLARAALEGSTNGSAPTYRLTVSTCDQCARSFQLARGELVEVAPAVAEMARCDSHVGATSKRLSLKVRREVLRRDHGCCVVPGCCNTRYVDVHHIDLRSEGGLHEPDNLIVLCGAHHSAVHRGTLRIDGRVSTGVRFAHADGTPYGLAPSPERSHVGARVFAALRGLGFPEKVARKALDRGLATLGASSDADELLRAALTCARAK